MHCKQLVACLMLVQSGLTIIIEFSSRVGKSTPLGTFCIIFTLTSLFLYIFCICFFILVLVKAVLPGRLRPLSLLSWQERETYQTSHLRNSLSGPSSLDSESGVTVTYSISLSPHTSRLIWPNEAWLFSFAVPPRETFCNKVYLK